MALEYISATADEIDSEQTEGTTRETAAVPSAEGSQL